MPKSAKFSIKEIGQTAGYDGHCLRAYAYFKDQMPGIENTVESINSIKKKYPEFRQNSKAPTFLLTYGGTYHGLIKNCGFSKEEALVIESRYHDLYKESDDYVAARLREASKVGYVDVAFGLRVRTPLLKQVMWETKTIPYEAAAEGRTAGNALGQSYGLLNTRAANAFMKRVWASENRYKVLPIAQIHDAQYYLIRNDPVVIKWVNNNLIEEMEWQDLPEITHPTVRLGAALDLFVEGWHEPITLPNRCSLEHIKKELE